MIKNIIVPHYVYRVAHQTQNFNENINLISCDTETANGKIFTIQFYKNKPYNTLNSEPIIIYTNPKNALDDFIKGLCKCLEPDFLNIVFFHNLKYDMSVILSNLFPENLLEKETTIVYKELGLQLFMNKLWWGIAKISAKDITIDNIKILDSMNFFNDEKNHRHSLEYLSKSLKLNHQKLKKPKDLGNRILTDKYFIDYALNDVLTQYDLGKFILDFCKSYNVKIPVSISQLAQYIFISKFLSKEDIVYLPNPACNYFSVMSYHGGKNAFYLDKVQKIPRVYELDVVSMYPKAMVSLPPFTHAKYKKVYEFLEDREGIYRINGYAYPSKYKIICDENFNYLSDTKFNNIYLTSFEIRMALENNLIDLNNDIEGYIIEPTERSKNPFIPYVDHFFNLKKNTQKSEPNREFFKLLCNALYGKFFQAVDTSETDYTYEPKTDKIYECPKFFRAGGLYNPLIASLITGYARSHLFCLEKKYESIDSSTDSIKTTIKPDKMDIGEDLGQLEIKGFGDTIFFRNKTYIMFSHPLIKYAYHGFGVKPTKERPFKPLEEMLRLYMTKSKDYTVNRMVQFKESQIQKELTPFIFHDFKKTFNVKY